MAGYRVGAATPAAAAGAAYCTIHASTATRVRVREIAITLNAATVSSIGLGRPANTPVASSSALAQKMDPNGGASLCALDTAWSTPPTAPSVFMSRVVLPATAGAGWIWTFPDDEPLILDTAAGSGQWVTLWNFGAGAGSVLNVSIVTKE